jgi:hypothetical protein
MIGIPTKESTATASSEAYESHPQVTRITSVLDSSSFFEE